jgi:anti-sigma regulatory factor (Ser/Thr protein kinase)
MGKKAEHCPDDLMKELSLHILDIAENSVRAGAATLEIRVDEDTRADLLSIEFIDDGCGMDEETLKRAISPFFTTKTVRKVGMGLSLLKRAAERTGGSLTIESTPGRGTRVCVTFQHSHIDRQPMGDIASTLITLMSGNPGMRIIFRHRKNEEEFIFDTDIVKSALDDIPVTHPDVVRFITELIRERKNLVED